MSVLDDGENGWVEDPKKETAKPGERSSGSNPGFKVLDRRFWVSEEGEADEEHETEPERSGAKPTYVEQLEQRALMAEEKLAEYIRAYKEQVDVELVKYRDRLERETSRQAEVDRGKLILELLEVLDNLDLSIASVQNASDLDALVKGIILTRDQFIAKLEAMGLSAVSALGEKFDPGLHEAVAVEPADPPDRDGTITEVFKPGYLLNDRLLRPAMVKVAKKS